MKSILYCTCLLVLVECILLKAHHCEDTVHHSLVCHIVSHILSFAARRIVPCSIMNRIAYAILFIVYLLFGSTLAASTLTSSRLVSIGNECADSSHGSSSQSSQRRRPGISPEVEEAAKLAGASALEKRRLELKLEREKRRSKEKLERKKSFFRMPISWRTWRRLDLLLVAEVLLIIVLLHLLVSARSAPIRAVVPAGALDRSRQV